MFKICKRKLSIIKTLDIIKKLQVQERFETVERSMRPKVWHRGYVRRIIGDGRTNTEP